MIKLVTIVGTGALGSHLVQFMRNLDVQLQLIDFDRIEQKNVRSQFHGKPHAGKLKVESLKQTMGLLWGSKPMICPAKLVTDNAATLLRGSDLVIDCVDNGDTRRLIQATVRRYNVPCLHGGLAADGTFGRIVWDEHFTIDDEPAAGAATCEDGDHLPFIAAVSAFLAQAVKEFLTTGKKLNFNVQPTTAQRF